MIEFRDIEILKAIVQQGGFRAAAEVTGVAQSAISNRIRHLESRLKVSIFEREGRGVRLTTIGRRLLEEAEILIAQRDRIISELTVDDMTGVVRFGVAETMGHTFLPQMLNRLKEPHPYLRFEISIETSLQMANDILKDDLDVAILLRDQAPSGCHMTPLPPVSLGWYARPGHFQLPSPAGIGDLSDLPIVTFSKTTLPHKRLVEMLAPVRTQAGIVHGSTSLATVMQLIALGFGVGTVPHIIAQASPHFGLQELAVSDDAKLPDLEYVICYVSERNDKIGRALTRFALETADQMILKIDQ
ncbi:LysR family transcriptional regulator [Cohaesibacter haloalkalitolerans]|uniref:LysR family transcriptional regulator n=1 Tax=Cohaesibacter haloalkalitolerans TaxID=1162980 RepID=UPI000E655166|nr:LysR family transcriptional regulator [Cohaesibacter haloalkalitolerans]